MTYRTRLTVMATLAVAVTLVGVSIVVYYAYRHELLHQADRQLGAAFGSLASSAVGNPLNSLPVKRATSYNVVLPGSSTALVVHIVPVRRQRAPDPRVGEHRYSTERLHGVPTRRLTILGTDPAVSVTRSLADVEHSLSRLRALLILACLSGIAVAALLGMLVARRAVVPLRRLTEAAERITRTGELSQRTGQRGRDEISQLSIQLDALLASLEESLRTQRQLVADASHELRTPIAALRANVALLIRPDELEAHEREDLVADVQDELDSMTTVVIELVELAQGQELAGEPTEFQLDELVQSAVDRAARRTKKVAFRAELEPTTVLGMPDRVERAVDNLLDNARKWSPAGETIDVTVRSGVLEVRDRGPGIAPEDAPLVFNRFYRSIRARGTPGAGLGLAIVKQVADAHNGSVTVEDAPEGGAILRMSFLRHASSNF
jgi:two-component system, OmpR family, sensor histidine kinase MprB